MDVLTYIGFSGAKFRAMRNGKYDFGRKGDDGMKRYVLTLLASLVLLTVHPTFAQWSDISMRKDVADRIVRAHNITFDWRNNSLTMLMDAEYRLDTVKRIQCTHGLLFDWQKSSLTVLLDTEARLNTVARIRCSHGLVFDWQKSSLTVLLDTEARLDTVARIRCSHGLVFDWKTSLLASLMDAEARLDAAKRLNDASGQKVDWKSYSLTQLLAMEKNQASQPAVSSASGETLRPSTSAESSRTPAYSYLPPVAENGDIRGVDNDGDGRTEPVHVRGYTRKDGTYVRGHYRASPKR
jgi:hypothetical protein